MRNLLADRPRQFRLLVLGTLILAAYSGAVSRDGSLLWVIAALLLSTLITGITWPYWLVSQLSVTRTGPERANEGETILFHVEVRNRGLLPRFMVELVDRLPFVGAATGTSTTGDRMLGVVTYVGGNERIRFDVALSCEKRGLYHLGPVSLASTFPLGLSEAKQRSNNGLQALIIYPEVFPIVALPLHGAPSQIHRGGFLLPEAAGAVEFCGLREYRRGDNPRHIHWPTSARQNELMVREFEPMAAASLCLALDLAADTNIGQGRHSTLEYALKIAASIAQHTCTAGMPVRMIGQGARSLNITTGSGENHYRLLLEELAIADADGDTPYSRLLEGLAMDCEPGETVVVFISETDMRLETTLQALALLRSCGAHILAISFDSASFDIAHRSRSAPAYAPPDTLLDLGATCISVGKGDDLFALFNP